VLAPVHGQAWRYRHRARLSVRWVAKKGGVLVGFRERHSSHVADMRACEVLPRPVSELIGPLRTLVGELSIRARLPQIEVAVGDAVTVLVLRVLDAPTDFTQVNYAVNELLVRRAIAHLDPRPGDRVLDLFCGLGNFSLPIAVRGGEVIGVEGSERLVERARENAAANGLVAQFNVANLFDAGACAALPRCDKLLLDPPREGAMEVVKALGTEGPQRVVYVSCDPATLARDAAVLVKTKGYRLTGAGIVNMFAHTAHVESMAVFEH
jgi:23S rRNA (uracil1939-C5)-methyltransferase